MQKSLARRRIKIGKFLRTFEQALVTGQILQQEERHREIAEQGTIRSKIVRRLTIKASAR
jgi:hypothetical protein